MAADSPLHIQLRLQSKRRGPKARRGSRVYLGEACVASDGRTLVILQCFLLQYRPLRRAECSRPHYTNINFNTGKVDNGSALLIHPTRQASCVAFRSVIKGLCCGNTKPWDHRYQDQCDT